MGEKIHLKIHLDKRNIKTGGENDPENDFIFFTEMSLPYLFRAEIPSCAQLQQLPLFRKEA